MKRYLSILACIVLVIAMVCSLASCEALKNMFDKPDDEHTHNFVDGKCDCGESDPDYVAHEHNFVDGKCECGESDPDYVAPHEHNFVDGKCECGELDPDYVAPTTGTQENPHALTVPGTLDVAFAGGYEPVWYSFTASETKTLGITLSSENADMGYGTSVDAMQYTGGKTYVEVNIEEGVTYLVNFSTVNSEADEYTVNAEYVVSPYEAVIYEGNYNTVTFSAEEIEAGEATRKLVITTASTYMFKGDVFVSKVVAAGGTEVTKNADYSYTLAAGEYTLTFGMFNIYGTAADTGVHLNVEDQEKEDVGGDDTDIDITGTYYGTDDYDNQSLTIVITDTTATFTYNHPMMGETVATYTYEIVEGEVVLYDDDNEVVPVLGGFITLSINGVPVDAGFNGTNYTLSTTQGGGSEGGDDDDTTLPEVGTGTGTEEDPYIIAIPGDFTCAFPGGLTPIWYAFAAPADGTVTISTTFGENGWLQLGTAPMFCNTNEGDGTSLTLFVEKDTLYYAAVGDWSEAASSVPFSIAFTEGTGGEGGGDDTTEIVTEGYLYDGENEVTITDAQYTAGKVYYAFTPWNEGEYYFSSMDLYVSGVYLNGVALTTNDDGYYVLSQNVQYVVEITCSWAPSAGTYTVNADFQYPLGHQENPIWLYSLGESITASYPGNYQPVWYQFYASANGTVTVTTDNATATILLTAAIGNEVESVDGTVSLTVMQGRKYYIGVADFSTDENYANPAAEITFTTALTEGDYVGEGTKNVPSILVLGANTASVPAWGDAYFAYTAVGNGVLTLTTESTNCSWYVTTDLSKWEFSTESTLSIQLYSGEIAYVCVSTADYAAADIVFNASFKADPTEAWYEGTVATDGTANTIVLTDNTYCGISVYGVDDKYTISWDVDGAIVTVNEQPVENGAFLPYSMYGGYYITVALPDYAAGTVKVTIAPYVESTANGSFDDPYTLEAENTCAFPGGMNYVFYKYTAEVAGTLTVTMTSLDFFWAYGANEYALETMGSSLATADIVLAAGESVWIGISTNSMSTGDVTFTSSFEEAEGGSTEPVADGSFANPYALEADNTCAFPGGWDYVFYKYTAEVAGTLTVTMTSTDFYWGYGAAQYELNNVATTASADIALAAGETVYIGISTNSSEAANVTFTATFTEGGATEPEEEKPLVLVLGTNSIEITEANVTAGAKEGTFVAPYTGAYTFASNDVGVKIFDGEMLVGMGMVNLEAGKTYKAVVTAMAEGTYSVNVSVDLEDLPMGNTDVTGDTYYEYVAEIEGTLSIGISSSATSTVYVTYYVNGGEEVKFSSISTTPSANIKLAAGDKVIIIVDGTTNLSASFTDGAEAVVGTPLAMGNNSISQHDVVYSYTAAEAGVLKLEIGGAVSGTVSVTYTVNGGESQALALNSSVEINLVAGDKVVITVDATGYSTITASFGAPSTDEGGDEEGGEDVGGGSTSDASGTYLSAKHGSGRYLKVIIDTATGTMTVIRSDMTGNFGTGGESRSEYTYDATAPIFVSGTNCTIVMENGVPTKITWGSAAFEGFTKQ